jgi:hypothetical protein
LNLAQGDVQLVSMIARRILTLLLLLSSFGCGIFGPEFCTAGRRWGVSVTVIDALDGSSITEGLAGVLVDGSFREDMLVFENILVGAGERAGRYDLTITTDGYAVFARGGIKVNRPSWRSSCRHVETVHITAELESSSPSV